MIEMLSFWSHVVAACAFGVLAARLAMAARRDPLKLSLVVASMATALWAIAVAGRGAESLLGDCAETLRNTAWLALIYLLMRRGARRSFHGALTAVYGALVLVAIGQTVLALAAAYPPDMNSDHILIARFSVRMIFSVGALFLVHNLYGATVRSARDGVGLPLAALAVMWGYDLNLYTLSYLGHGWSPSLLMGRGAVVAVLAPVFALATKRNQDWTIRLSRSVAFRSVSLGVIAGYLVAMSALSALSNAFTSGGAQLVQATLLVAAGVAAVIILPSARLRAWIRVVVAKNLFAHRYDYRAEWLRFTETLGAPGDVPTPLEMRVIKAIANITESPAGLLLAPEGDGLRPVSAWNSDSAAAPAFTRCHALCAMLVSGRVIELDRLREAASESCGETRALPTWILDNPNYWAIVPLVHFDRLVGAALIERPALARSLDWEDFDLLRLTGRQVASYLAEAHGQDQLAEAARFDEFNRRFAFIIHDIKNLASQLTLVARNAERHASNPAFQTDMIATLNGSTARMNDLLARLTQHDARRTEAAHGFALAPVIDAVAAVKRQAHPIVVTGECAQLILADAARLETAVSHLVQNAIDASSPSDPVTISLSVGRDGAIIEIVDTGCGMSADFVRGSLFRPFASTKDAGFGIGAYESRALVCAMGGQLTVVSTPGVGTRFTITLPLTTGWTGAIAA